MSFAHAWPRLHFTADVSPAAFGLFLKDAQASGFLSADVDISRLVELP